MNTAAANYALARRAERRDPAGGEFITVDGVRLHYIERGTGPTIVLLHGNGAMARDFVLSGLFDLLATDHRVIAFDRPGFGFARLSRGRSALRRLMGMEEEQPEAVAAQARSPS